MKQEKKLTYIEKGLQYVLGMCIGTGLWALTLMILLILN
ncbi:Uncharacterised protein [Legionella moravica]|uniref:Uncharacterized protein n=1 Tax=Legionella moravica TaxID=39962 RepID=A0A378JZU8_9GAMM|nr:Uncharacterised protein [Legionella moravica]